MASPSSRSPKRRHSVPRDQSGIRDRRRPSEPSTDGQAITTAVVLLRTFARRGVRVVYGIPGASVSPIFDALVQVPELVYIATRHESIAAFAAMGHARATGLPALVLT